MAKIRNSLGTGAVAIAAALALAGCGMLQGEKAAAPSAATSQNLTLTGAHEVPPVSTSASGSGWVNIRPDGTVSAKITVTGMTPTAAHIHEASAGANGPVIVPFTKQGEDTFVAPPGSRLTEGQMASYMAGRLYVNVHSAKSPSGEIRAQLHGSR
jgi:hypothetical protein